MTVAELFTKACLSPRGPVRWETPVPEPSAGVYVVARVENESAGCVACDLPFIDPLPVGLELHSEYERRRWLATEPIVYIGKTDRSIRERVCAFYCHKCGNRSPHAGGQVVKLLRCDLWVYWSPAADPLGSERKMIRAFEEQANQKPFANWDGKGGKRICLLVQPKN